MKGNWKEMMKKTMIVLGVLVAAVVGGFVLYYRWNAKTASDYYGEYVESGKACMEEGIYRDAIAWFEKAEEIHADENVQVAIAECYLNLGDETSFKMKADMVRTSYGVNERLYQDLAYYYRQMQDTPDEIEILAEGVEAYPEDSGLRRSYDAVKGEYTDVGMPIEQVQNMINGYAIVQTENGWQVWNRSLSRLGQTNYEEIYDLSTDSCIKTGWADATLLYSAKQDGVAAYYDQSGYRRRSPEKQYRYLGTFRDGYALVQSDQGWGYIDMDFNECSAWYEDATSFADGMAAVKQDGTWIFINTELLPMQDTTYTDVVVDAFHRCSVGGAAFARRDGRYVMVTKDGEQEGDYEQAKPFLENGGYAACYSDGTWKLVDRKGTTVPVGDCEDLASTSGGIAVYRRGDGYGYVSAEDGVYTEPVFEEAGSVNEKGYAPVKKEDTWSFIHFERFNVNDGIL